ncbi:hypothetical protein LCGC14_2736700 [marine sediment metagenome]|uniref:Uncharacterized protein n=1 Tax=marine sediment metagenome TaxID=412755 RepID=A0A0F8Z5M7_9ZZZZ
MSRYSKQHYDDVAHIFAQYPRGLHDGVVKDFADLFAADNPSSDYCGYCGTDGATSVACPGRSLALGHSLVQHKGFDREQFLSACGLATEPTCPLCGNPCSDVGVHQTCVDKGDY